VCNAIAARDHKQPRAEDGVAIIPVAAPLTAGMAASANRQPHEQGALIPIAFDAQAGGETALATGDVDGTLHGGGKHGGRAAVAFQDRFRGDDGRGYARPPMALEEHTGTLETVKPWHVALGHNGGPPLWQVRRLTPRECERLQGFPDGYTDVPYRGRNWTADGPRYKALGNSMAVNVMHYLGARIALVDGLVVRAAA